MLLQELVNEPTLSDDPTASHADVIQHAADKLLTEALAAAGWLDLGVWDDRGVARLVEVRNASELAVDIELVPADLLIASHVRHHATALRSRRPPSMYQMAATMNQVPLMTTALQRAAVA